jgi:hypothetical protein
MKQRSQDEFEDVAFAFDLSHYAYLATRRPGYLQHCISLRQSFRVETEWKFHFLSMRVRLPVYRSSLIRRACANGTLRAQESPLGL